MGESVTRPMDRVLDAWSAGDHAGALRWAVPLLEAQPDSALALLATAYLGAKEGDPKTFDLGLKVAAHHAIDLGNLPLAVAVGALTRELGLDPSGTYDAIAAAYARGSARIKHGAPPALPAPAPDVRPLPETLLAKPLLDRALGAVEKTIEQIEAETRSRIAAPAGSALLVARSHLTPRLRRDFRDQAVPCPDDRRRRRRARAVRPSSWRAASSM